MATIITSDNSFRISLIKKINKLKRNKSKRNAHEIHLKPEPKEAIINFQRLHSPKILLVVCELLNHMLRDKRGRQE